MEARQRRLTGMVLSKTTKIILDNIYRGMHLNSSGCIVMPTGRVCHGNAPQSCSGGYRRITLYWKNGKDYTQVLYARVVCWLTYGPPPSLEYEVDHINRDRLDDRPENLRWVTRANNLRNVSWELKHKKKDTGLPKLNKKDVNNIRELYNTGWFTQRLLASIFGVGYSNVCYIVNNKSWRYI